MAIISIPKIFATVAAAVNKTFSERASDDFQVYFDYGHYIEVMTNLVRKDNSISQKEQKYPLIWLVMDFPEVIDARTVGYCTLPKIDMLIVVPTTPDLTTSERIEKTFVPRLYPIYEELLKQIALSGLFLQQSVMELYHEKIDRPYWGMQDVQGNGQANLFNDFIDAIQIRGMRLNVLPTKDPACLV
jgi:hypothetical protein